MKLLIKIVTITSLTTAILQANLIESSGYIYSFKDNVPNIRIYGSDGHTEIYTSMNINEINESEIKKLHQRFYKNMNYEELKQEISKKYKVKIISTDTKSTYDWKDYSKYLEMKALIDIITK